MISFAILSLLSCLAAGSDIVRRTIPNWLNLLVFIAGLATLFIDPSMEKFVSHIGHFILALIVGMALFKFGMWGGGDAKFYSATAVWFSIGEAPVLALITALAGVIVVIAGLVGGRAKSNREWSVSLPYGVAIAVGAIITGYTRVF